MTEWKYVEVDAPEQLSRLEYFGFKKHQDGGGIDFVITVHEYLTPPDPAMRFYAKADKQTNQSKAPYTPVGWGPNLGTALWECVQAIRRFPYEG
jgi:hypothetical protein